MLPGFAAAIIALAGCWMTGRSDAPASNEHGAAIHWGYEDDDGPSVWGSMDPRWRLCDAGGEQSPVDLRSATVRALPPVAIDTPTAERVRVLNQTHVIHALDNGHTIQVDAPTGGALVVGGKRHLLLQFHYHAPSEHTVDGRHYPMEMHFLNQAEDGSLAVLGLLVEPGVENPAVAELWDQLDNEPGSETDLQLPEDFARSVFAGEGTGVFHYRGSLTTPPCSEGVAWYVRRTPTQLSPAQIAAFTAVYDHNNRPVQRLGDRRIFIDPDPDVAID